MTPDGQTEPQTDAAEREILRCDFCERETPTVRRIALDREYERLRTPHRVRYACPECSESKERRREGA